jgi:iron complex transport system permease protein
MLGAQRKLREALAIFLSPLTPLGVCILSVCVALVAALVALFLGETTLELSRLADTSSPEAEIFFSLRLPRVVLAGLVGMGLSVSGAVLQTSLRNPLADPFILGVSGGAALGANLAMSLGLSGIGFLSGSSVLALLGALLATLFILWVGPRVGAGASILLAGVMFNAFAMALISFLRALTEPGKLGELLFWLSGVLRYEAPETLWGLASAQFLSFGLLWALASKLNALSLGDEDAQSLGINVRHLHRWLYFLCSLSVASAVAFSGLIGFVGLLVPHLTRRLLGADMRKVLPGCAGLGAAFLILADMLSRWMFRSLHTELPVGAITALLGGPLFFILWMKRPFAHPRA